MPFVLRKRLARAQAFYPDMGDAFARERGPQYVRFGSLTGGPMAGALEGTCGWVKRIHCRSNLRSFLCSPGASAHPCLCLDNRIVAKLAGLSGRRCAAMITVAICFDQFGCQSHGQFTDSLKINITEQRRNQREQQPDLPQRQPAYFFKSHLVPMPLSNPCVLCSFAPVNRTEPP